MKMKKIMLRLIGLALVLAMTNGLFSVWADSESGTDSGVTAADSENTSGDNQTTGFLKKGRYGSAEEMLQSMTSVAVSGDLELFFSEDTADIAVRHTSSGDIWLSTPYDYKNDAKASDEIKTLMGSFIRLTYYDTQSNRFEMNGYSDCILKSQFSSERIENGVRIDMRIGKGEDSLSLPLVAEASRFEEKVINTMSGIAKRRVEAFYTRYSAKDDSLDSAVKQRILALYPGFADYDLYILRDDASDRDKQMLTEYLETTAYSREDYADDLVKSGAADQSDVSALFNISVEFTLDSGGLKVNIPTDSISYDRTNFVLNKIRLLEYFGAGKSSNGGYLFMPDGSGSLINFNTDSQKKILSTVCSVYGQDYTLLQNNEYQNLSQQCYLPVFGIKEGDRAFLAIIEDGDAIAQITSESGNIVSEYETIAVDFTYATVQTYLYNDNKKQNGQWTYTSKNYYDGNFCIRYEFLTGDSADYVGMAKCYREYLKGQGVLKPIEADGGLPIYLETIGQITRRDSFFGIPYNRKVDITSFSDAQEMLEELKESGVADIRLRYKGWMNGGLNGTVPSKLSVERKLGGAKGLENLAAYIRDNGSALFPEVNFNIVRCNTLFDGFTSLFDSPRSNDDHIAAITPPEEINNISKKQNLYSAVSPSKLSKYYSAFFGKYNSYGIGAVAISYAGNMLYSDFAKKGGTTRQQALDILRQNIEANTSGKRLMTDGGNAYIFSYATDILNLPSSDGGSLVQDESIPFIQLVLHGYISYAGSAVNLSDNRRTELLKSAEGGAALYFTLGYKNTEYLKDTPLSYLYSVDYNTWKSDMVELYQKYNDAFASLQTCEIVDHERIGHEVYKTTYDNSVSVIVNYSDKEINVDGVAVGAMDFSVVK